MKRLFTISTLALALTAAACGDQKTPAEAALKAAQDGYAAISADAQKYVPDQAKGVQEAIDAAKAADAKGDYAAVLTQAQALPAKISAVGQALAAKKTELTTAFASLSAGLPQVVDALKKRMDTLAQSKGLPAGMTKETLEGLKTSMATVTQEMSDAMTAGQAGDMATAMAKANDVKTKAIDMLKTLKMPVPPALGGGN